MITGPYHTACAAIQGLGIIKRYPAIAVLRDTVQESHAQYGFHTGAKSASRRPICGAMTGPVQKYEWMKLVGGVYATAPALNTTPKTRLARVQYTK